ncbi:MAG: hypothetical protein NT117_08820 [Gammaproteobacteria bacterium]|nr:hypothetical protein [Gammaproteobacteria bacterium]
MNLSKLSKLSPRTIVLGLAGAAVFGMLAIVVAFIVIWRSTEWNSAALAKMADATVAMVSGSGEHATRVLEGTQGAAAVTEAARALEDARTSFDRTRDALADPQAALASAADGAIQDATRAVAATAATAAAVAPALADRVDAMALNSSTGPDPQPWPKGLALRQTQYRQAGEVTEYAYVALAPEFDLGQMRQKLIALGYVEQVLAQNRSALEVMYRGERQLFLTATLRDGRQHINIRDLPIAGGE